MASFFRKRIAQKVISLLQRRYEIEIPYSPNLVSSNIKLNRNKCQEPELVLPWKRIEHVCNSSNLSVSPKELVRLLRNQGLPTAEGFIDIKLVESSLNLIFTVDKHIFSKIVLLDICTNNENLAKSSCLFEEIEKQNIVVQSSFPSIGNPCHMTHFRTAVYSQFVTNINIFAGHNVTNVVLLNDWGITGAIFLTGYKKFKDDRCKESPSNLFQIMKVSLLQYKNNLSFKKEVDAVYSKLLKGDLTYVKEWQNLKDVCISYYNYVCEKIGVNYNEILFDSCFYGECDRIADELLEKNIYEKNDDEINSNNEPGSQSDPTPLMTLNSTLHNLSRYIASALQLKKTSQFDSLYYIVPQTQKDFCSLLLAILRKLNFSWAGDVHQIDLPSCDFRSKKILKTESIENILDKVKEEILQLLHNDLQMEWDERLEKLAEHLGITSLVIHNIKRRRTVNYRFDLEEITSFERDTGAAFQLCYAGLKGLYDEDSKWEVQSDIDTSPLLETQAQNLIRHLARFDEMAFKSYTLLEPCIMFQYLSSLWYFTDQASNVLKLDRKHNRRIVIQARLLLLSATLKIFEQGLRILGIKPLEKICTPEKSFIDEKLFTSSNKKNV